MRRGRAHDSHHGPTAEQILRASDQRLRGAGLSRSKVLSLRDLARRAKGGEIPTLAEVHRMADEAILSRLSEVRGIGRWTVEMLRGGVGEDLHNRPVARIHLVLLGAAIRITVAA